MYGERSRIIQSDSLAATQPNDSTDGQEEDEEEEKDKEDEEDEEDEEEQKEEDENTFICEDYGNETMTSCFLHLKSHICTIACQAS